MRLISTALLGVLCSLWLIAAPDAPKPMAKAAPTIKDAEGPDQFLTLKGKQAGLWVTPNSSDLKGATLYYIAGQGPVIAIYDHTKPDKQNGAHQFAVYLDGGRPFIQIAAPGNELRRIDLERLADMLAEWETKQKR